MSRQQIVLRQYPPNMLTSPKEVNPTVIYARPPPAAAQTIVTAASKPVTILRDPRVMIAPSNQPKIIRLEDDDDSIASDYVRYNNKNYSKLLSGFHPYYDKETDILALQCCTCCIGCWRRISTRCTGCENFISCPIYCWLMFILPIFVILVCALVVTSVYAAHWFH